MDQLNTSFGFSWRLRCVAITSSVVQDGGWLRDKLVAKPNTKGGNIVISIIAQHAPNNDGMRFLDDTREVLQSAVYGFKFSVLKDELQLTPDCRLTITVK